MKFCAPILLYAVWCLLGNTVASAAEPSEADRKLLAEIRTTAEKGNTQSQFELGTAFDLGRLGVVKEPVEAAKWYRRAAEQNYALAQFNLGVCYANGEGVAKDEVEAAKWYRKAADQNTRAGSVQSRHLLRQRPRCSGG